MQLHYSTKPALYYQNDSISTSSSDSEEAADSEQIVEQEVDQQTVENEQLQQTTADAELEQVDQTPVEVDQPKKRRGRPIGSKSKQSRF